MAVFRVIKDKDNPYVMINKYFVYDGKLSLKAKGLMSYFLSRPDNWEFYSSEIEQNCKDGERAISTAIKELETNGYIERLLKRDSAGKLIGGYDYTIYEMPKDRKNDETTCTKEEPKRQNAESAKCLLGKTPIRQNSGLLNNELKLNNDINSSSRKEQQEIINYYCDKALITELHLKPIELETINKIIQDSISVAIAKQGIDLAFKNFKPNFEGDRIKSFKYCEPVIRHLAAKKKAKEEGEISGADRNNVGEELKQQGIGL